MVRKIGDVLAGRYQIRGKMGTGGFAEIYLGYDLITGTEVAIKAQLESMTTTNALKLESEVLSKIEGRFAPKMLHYSAGNLSDKRKGTKRFPFIVMELLKGEDMSELRHRQKSSRIPVRTAAYLAQEMIRLLQQLHRLGYIHRDIKPNNFMRKSLEDKQFWVIDFGIAKSIFDDSGRQRAEREKADFRGTTMYASVRAHQSKDLSFRDDLFSCFYVFMDLVLGRLPWAGAAKAKNKTIVLELKEKYLKNPSLIVEEDPVLSSRVDKNQLIDRIKAIVHFLQKLEFQDEPNYTEVLSIFDDLKALDGEPVPKKRKEFDWCGAEGEEEEADDAHDCKREGKMFLSGYQRAQLEEEQMDSRTSLHVLTQQIHALVRADEGAGLGIPEIELARMWTRVAKRVLAVASEKYDRQQRFQHLSSCIKIARRHETFFLVDGLTEKEFAEIQLEAVYGIEKAYSRTKKKMRMFSSSNGAQHQERMR